MNTRPAASVFFHALNALIRSNGVHGTSTAGLAFRSVSAVFTILRHWLNANLDAPAWRRHTIRSAVTCQPTLSASHAGGWTNSPATGSTTGEASTATTKSHRSTNPEDSTNPRCFDTP